MNRSRIVLLLLLTPLTPALFSVLSRAADGAPPAPPKPQPPAALRAYVSNENDRLESEIAGLIQKHAALAAGTSGWLDLQIDCRVLSRWIAQQLIDAEPGSDAQAVAWLRYQDALSLAAAVDTAAAAAAAPTPAQAAALASIHKATFDLKAAETVAQIDGILGPLRAPLLALLGGGKGVDARPALNDSPAATVADKPIAPETPPSIDSLSTRITQLSISIPLRQQLLAAAGAARKATGDEADRVTAVLRDAVALAGVLQTNVAVDPDTRAAMEKQLGDALALSTDPRLREAGQQRMAALGQYRSLSTRIGALKLTPDIAASLTPALNAAREKPKSAELILSTIEQFAAIDAKMAGKTPAAPADAAARAADGQLKLYADERASFLGEAEQMGSGGAFAVTADNLHDHIARLRNIQTVYETLKTLPQAQATLLTFRPRPTGGLEKRIVQAVVHSSDPTGDQAQAATEALLNVGRIAAAWQACQSQKPIADETMHVYTGQTWDEASASIKSLASELTTALASGGDVDAGKVAALGRVPALFDAVREMDTLQSRFAGAAALSRWADCDLNDKKLIAVLDRYQSDFSSLAAATLSGGGEEKDLRDLQSKYRGLLATLDLLASAAPECEKLPDGVTGIVCRFTTPSANATREASLRSLCWTTDLIGLLQSATDTDSGEVNRLRDRLLKNLNRTAPAPAS